MSFPSVLKSVYLKPTLGGILLFLFTMPGMLLLARMLAFFLPDAVYYPLSSYSGFMELTPLLIVMPLIGWPLAHMLSAWIAGRSKAWRISIRAALVVVIIGATVLGAAVSLWSPGRFNVGHPYCQTPLLVEVDRCEGIDRGFMQGRISAVAMAGEAVADIEKVATTFPEYNLFQIECADLAGGFGERCYAGSFLRSTGDTNFMNLYLYDQKAIVLITENIPPMKRGANGFEHDTFKPDMLSDFVDLTRFRSEFKEVSP